MDKVFAGSPTVCFLSVWRPSCRTAQDPAALLVEGDEQRALLESERRAERQQRRTDVDRQRWPHPARWSRSRRTAGRATTPHGRRACCRCRSRRNLHADSDSPAAAAAHPAAHPLLLHQALAQAGAGSSRRWSPATWGRARLLELEALTMKPQLQHQGASTRNWAFPTNHRAISPSIYLE
jgi:hypothetical protein